MLLGNFYHILKLNQKDNFISARVELNPEHAIFKGHFPDTPIMPGVCQLQMMEEILSRVLRKNLKVKHATQIKFLSFVNPMIHKQLDINLKIEIEENALVLVEGNYFWEQTIFLKFNGEFDEHRSV